MYSVRALTWPSSCTKGWGKISTPWKKIITGGGLNTAALGLENKNFSGEDQCQCMNIWRFFTYIFFRIRKTPTKKIPSQKIFPNQTLSGEFSPGKFPHRKFPAGIFPSMFLNVTTKVHFCFFHYCHRYHWYYLKDCFEIRCFKNAEVFTFVKVCQNEVLSEERQIMKWVTAFQVRIFWVEIFREEISRRKFDG